MDYGTLFTNAVKLTWRYKTFWLVAFLVYLPNLILVSGMSGAERTGAFQSFDLNQLFAMFGLLVSYLILLFLIQSYTTPVLIDATNRIMRGGEYRFADSFAAGVRYFFRYIGLQMVGFGISLVVIIILMIITFIGVVIVGVAAGDTFTGDGPVGVLLTIVSMIVIGIPLALVYIIIFLAARPIVIRDVSIGDGLSEAWKLFKSRPWPIILVHLIIFAIAFPLGYAATFWQGAVDVAVGNADLSPVMADLVRIGLSLPMDFVQSVLVYLFGLHFVTLLYFELVEPGKAQMPEDDEPSPPPPPQQPGDEPAIR